MRIKTLPLYLVWLIYQTNLFAQIVMDLDTRLPIAYVRINSSDLPHQGEFTNEDGRVNVLPFGKGDSLWFRHIAYQPQTIAAQALQPTDTIWLTPREVTLPEVAIYGLTPKALLERVIDRLDSNHQVGPVLYGVRVYEAHYTQDSARTLHMLREHDAQIYEKANGRALLAFQQTQSRVRTFSRPAERYLKSAMLLHGISSLLWNSLCRAKENCLKKRKLDNYEIRLEGQLEGADQHLIIVTLSPIQQDKDSRYTFWIEETSFAVVKITERRPDGTRFETGFMPISDQWYLAYFKQVVPSRTHYQKHYGFEQAVSSEQVAIYRVLDQQPTEEPPGAEGYILSGRYELKEVAGAWDDPFWQEHPARPWPEWIAGYLSED
jgi:hypothetical protein